ncbi:beta-ketoacyl-ACP synthase II [Paenibacillus antri]|uniref:3-oxoacyl-[acyl-carrier-protein] synthase 2 n=1 Tax=Paenibacillus antri TaxID=2582848 RepID=A0A5R9G5X9_9BACL|nr:beta-ketoacyl-ACP synthase II [Paenibacillus antri]TLS51191.1 beta-ketoacyl-ACP synthase II [Paenibacillus antri]
MEKRRVVVTGMGVVSPIGSDVTAFGDALATGRSGITTIDAFDPAGYPTRMAGQVRDFRPEAYMGTKEARVYDRFLQFAVASAKQAIAASGLDVAANADRVGVYVGSGIGGIHTLLDNHRQFAERGPKRVSPFMIPMMIGNMAAGQLSILTGARGPTFAPVSACATGNHAIGEAFHAIRAGRADAMIAGGAEAPIHELAFAGFCNMHAMSGRNDDPTRASRPFDADRDGFVMGEGAGILVLEELESALARGADIWAEVAGYGASSDAYHITATDPEGRGAYMAMKAALDDASLRPEEIDYINAHGTGTPVGDASETKAILALFPRENERPPVSSTKSMTGHLFGAAGAVEAVASVLAIRRGLLPPTINYETPDPACALDVVPNVARPAAANAVLSNGFGFGGHNAVLAFRRYFQK